MGRRRLGSQISTPRPGGSPNRRAVRSSGRWSRPARGTPRRRDRPRKPARGRPFPGAGNGGRFGRGDSFADAPQSFRPGMPPPSHRAIFLPIVVTGGPLPPGARPRAMPRWTRATRTRPICRPPTGWRRHSPWRCFPGRCRARTGISGSGATRPCDRAQARAGASGKSRPSRLPLTDGIPTMLQPSPTPRAGPGAPLRGQSPCTGSAVSGGDQRAASRRRLPRPIAPLPAPSARTHAAPSAGGSPRAGADNAAGRGSSGRASPRVPGCGRIATRIGRTCLPHSLRPTRPAPARRRRRRDASSRPCDSRSADAPKRLPRERRPAQAAVPACMVSSAVPASRPRH